MSKEYSDQCFNCSENKEAIRESQRRENPLYCVTGSNIPEVGWEADHEYDHHRFVRTIKQKLAEEADELAYAEQMNDFVNFVEANP